MNDITQPAADMKNVVFVNDDETTAEYVGFILSKVFDINEREARKLVTKIDKNGEAVVATLPAEQADAKVAEVLEYNAVMGFALQVKTADPSVVAPAPIQADGTDQVLDGYAVVLHQTSNIMNKKALGIINKKFGAVKSDDELQQDFEDIQKGREIVWRVFDNSAAGEKNSRLAFDVAESIVSDYNERCDGADDYLLVGRKSPGEIVSKKNVDLPSFEDANAEAEDNLGQDLLAGILGKMAEKAGGMDKVREQLEPEDQERLDKLLGAAGKSSGPKI